MVEITVTIIILGWLAAFVLFAPAGFAARFRFPSGADSVPGQSRPASRISCIIPARNEEERIAPLLESIAAQSEAPAEVIVVDDESTDHTASLARSYGARVVAAGPRPEGWTGKPWACQQGAITATGDIYLFLDADVILGDEALSTIHRTLHRGHVVSIQPFHVAPTVIEKLSALFNLQSVASVGLGTAGPIPPEQMIPRAHGAAVRAEPRQELSTPSLVTKCAPSSAPLPGVCFRLSLSRRIRALKAGVSKWANRVLSRTPTGGLFGPFIAIHALDYEAFGGHRRVSGSILEDVHLGRVAREAGLTVHTWLGAGLARFRMYPDGFKALFHGWTKNLLAGARSSSAITLALQALFISGAATVTTQTALALFDRSAISTGVVLAAYAGYTLLLASVLPGYGSFRGATAALFPVHLLFYFAVCIRAMAFQYASQEVTWRGRRIEAERTPPLRSPRRISPHRA